MSRLNIRAWFILLILVQISFKATGEPSHESSVRAPEPLQETSPSQKNPHEECCYGRNGKLSQLESLAEQPGFERERDQIKAFVDQARKGGLSPEDSTSFHNFDLNNYISAVTTTAGPVTSGPAIAPGANSLPSFRRPGSSPVSLSPSPPAVLITSGTDKGPSQKPHEAAVGAAAAIAAATGPGLTTVIPIATIPLPTGTQPLTAPNSTPQPGLPKEASAPSSTPPKVKGGSPQPESTPSRLVGESTLPTAQTPAVAPTSSPATPSAVNPSPLTAAVPTTPEPKNAFVPQTPVVAPNSEPKLPLSSPTPVAVTPKAEDRPKPPASNPENALPSFTSNPISKGTTPPDFSFALTQNFNFNRPTPGPENKKDLSPIGPLPLPDFYATAVPVAPIKPEAPRLLVEKPTPGPSAESIKKPELVAAPIPVPGIKIEKLPAPEMAKATPALETLSLIKNSATPSQIPLVPLQANTNVSPLSAQSGIAQSAMIPTVVLPVFPEKNKEIQMSVPAERSILTLPVLQSTPAKLPGASSPVITANSSPTNTSEASTKQAARTTLSTYSGLFDEIRSILVAKKSVNSLETSSLQEFPQGEPTRQLSSVEFSPTHFKEPTLWKVVFLEKSGKQLSLVNVMIAFGSTLLLIWILLMRLRRESKAAGAAQSALSTRRDSAANRPDFNAP
ncbi:hypothetical protein EBQ90_06600 [bacterium]|nr:hypothetical protein [bacterium]